MVKNIHTKVTDEMYYELLSHRVKLRLDSWTELFDYILKQPDSPIETKPYNQKPLPKWVTNYNVNILKTIFKIQDDMDEGTACLAIERMKANFSEKLDQKPALPRWLTETNLAALLPLFNIPEDASEHDAKDDLEMVGVHLKIGRHVGTTGLSDLRRYWLTRPPCTCGHPRSHHRDAGCQTNDGVCICKKYIAAESATSAQEPDQIVVDQEASNF